MSSPTRLMLRFHASGPDGMQSGPFDANVPVTPYVRLVHVIRVSLGDVGIAWWDFDVDVYTSGIPEPALQINGMSPLTSINIAEDTLACTYPGPFADGDPWTIETYPSTLYSSVPIAVPQSGVFG